MNSEPAEVDIDIGLIESLVHEQFPEVTGALRIVGGGWDNVIARVGDDLCVRMPRRELSAPLTQHEADWLPQLAKLLPVDVPSAIAVGQPAPDYPWTWLICPWFAGRNLSSVSVPDRVLVATHLGEFVAALHRPAPEDAPVSPWRGIPLADVEPVVENRLAQLQPADASLLLDAWTRGASAPAHGGPPMWLHGDLHPMNLLVNFGAVPALRAVIDWGDICCGDPATDLAIAWLGFDEVGREAFRQAASIEHPPDDPIWDRALAWAVTLGVLFLLDAEPETEAHGIGEHLLVQLRRASANRVPPDGRACA